MRFIKLNPKAIHKNIIITEFIDPSTVFPRYLDRLQVTALETVFIIYKDTSLKHYRDFIDSYITDDTTSIYIDSKVIYKQITGNSSQVIFDRMLGDFSFYKTNIKLFPVPTPQEYINSVKKQKIAPKILEKKETNRIDTSHIKHIYCLDSKKARVELTKLFKAKEITCDIETTGLKWHTDSLLTISFKVLGEDEAYCFPLSSKLKGLNTPKIEVDLIKDMISKFFKHYKGKIIGHNFIGFDMAFILNSFYPLKKEQYDVLNKLNLYDTLFSAYANLNSTSRDEAGLKSLTYQQLGEYDKEIDQSELINTDYKDVMRYNNIDCVATELVYNKYKNMEQDVVNMMNIQAKMLLKVKMEGLVVDKVGVKHAIDVVNIQLQYDKDLVAEHKYTKKAIEIINEIALLKYNRSLKTKQVSMAEYKKSKKYITEFNSGSSSHKSILYYEVMKMPRQVLTKAGIKAVEKAKNKAKSASDEVIKAFFSSKEDIKEYETELEKRLARYKNFSTGKEAIEEWLTFDIPEIKKEFLQLVQDVVTAETVISNFLGKFKDDSVLNKDHWRIFTNFNSTGTISGRLSSSGGINFQNLPSGSKYGKTIKNVLVAPRGFVVGAIDYNALEDRLMAIESLDESKLRIFKENIDGHCLNASAYFNILTDGSAKAINALKNTHPEERQKGKGVTFGLNYGAGIKKIATMLKIPEDDAKDLVGRYKELYKGVYSYKKGIAEKALKDGFVRSRFSGLKLILDGITSSNGAIASKDSRVANNFDIQSGGYLTINAMVKFQEWIESENLIDDVMLVNTVHDSIYMYIRDDVSIIKRVNEKIVGFMTMDYKENMPIHLEADLEVGYNQKELMSVADFIASKVASA